MIAAMMTAANLGARVTGWGFVVFTPGSICWSMIGLSTGQNNLLASNAFLTLINLVGIWRWLGRQRAYEDGGRTAESKSRRSSAPTLFTATGVAGMPVSTSDRAPLGKAVEALLECATGEISYIVVATSGVGSLDETLRAVPRSAVKFSCEELTLTLSTNEFDALAPLESGDWPGEAPDRTVLRP
jgi:hypothetical protein